MDPMTAGRKIRLHVDLLDKLEYKEGSLHICCDCFSYTEHPVLWFIDYRFYPYCINCIYPYFQDKIDFTLSRVLRRRYACHGSRT